MSMRNIMKEKQRMQTTQEGNMKEENCWETEEQEQNGQEQNTWEEETKQMENNTIDWTHSGQFGGRKNNRIKKQKKARTRFGKENQEIEKESEKERGASDCLRQGLLSVHYFSWAGCRADFRLYEWNVYVLKHVLARCPIGWKGVFPKPGVKAMLLHSWIEARDGHASHNRDHEPGTVPCLLVCAFVLWATYTQQENSPNTPQPNKETKKRAWLFNEH